MKLYYSPGACSMAARIALEEAGARYEAIRVTLAEKENRKPEFLALNPQGRVPVLSVDGTVLTELPAILTYVDRKFPEARLMPADPLHHARAMSLMAFFASSVHIGFHALWRPERFSEDQANHPSIEQTAKRALMAHFGIVESRLPDLGWVGGERFCLADINVLPMYRWGWRVGLPMQEFPRYTALVAAASTRPAVLHVLEREGIPSLLAPLPESERSSARRVA